MTDITKPHVTLANESAHIIFVSLFLTKAAINFYWEFLSGPPFPANKFLPPFAMGKILVPPF